MKIFVDQKKRKFDEKTQHSTQNIDELAIYLNYLFCWLIEF